MPGLWLRREHNDNYICENPPQEGDILEVELLEDDGSLGAHGVVHVTHSKVEEVHRKRELYIHGELLATS